MSVNNIDLSRYQNVKNRPTYFNLSWLKLPQYADWLAATNTNEAKCKLCNHTFSLSNMGKQALNSHMDGKTQKA